MNKSFLVLLLALTAGCVQATADDSLSVTQKLQFDTPVLAVSPLMTCDQGGPVFETQTNTVFDESNYFSQLQKVGTLTATFTDNSLSGDLHAFKHATLYIAGKNGSPVLLADTNFTPVNGKVQVPLKMSADTLLNLLAAGPVTITAHLQTCIPGSSNGKMEVDYTLGATVDFSVNKGL